jgi:hypothetical protein
MPFDCLREVPWFETTATDQGERASVEQSSSEDVTERVTDGAIEARLQALGYR